MPPAPPVRAQIAWSITVYTSRFACQGDDGFIRLVRLRPEGLPPVAFSVRPHQTFSRFRCNRALRPNIRIPTSVAAHRSRTPAEWSIPGSPHNDLSTISTAVETLTNRRPTISNRDETRTTWMRSGADDLPAKSRTRLFPVAGCS